MLVGTNHTFVKTEFDNEAEVEDVVQRYAAQLFGSDSIIYLPKAKISTAGGTGIIPDGFVIDIEGAEWFLVEAERGVHGTWEHIAPQVSKQLTAADTVKTRDAVLRMALDAVASDPDLLGVFSGIGVSELNIHSKLKAILDRPPTIAIPIDRIPADLQEWAATLRTNVKIWEISKYVSEEDRSVVLYSLPEEGSPTVTTVSQGSRRFSGTSTSGPVPLQELIRAGLLNDGQRLVLDYQRKGQPKLTLEGIVRADGVEIDGKVYSPSTAALVRLRFINPNLKAVNGWRAWRTSAGAQLAELRDKLPTSALGTEADPRLSSATISSGA